MQPLATLGIQVAATAVDAALRATSSAADTVGGIVTASVEIAGAPVREGVKLLSGQASVSTLRRRSCCGEGRAWIEVRNLDSADGAARGRGVADRLRSAPGVRKVSLNHPLSRVVVEFDGDQTSLSDLCRAVDDAERLHRPADGATHAARAPHVANLPGDGLVLVTRGMMVGLNAAGLAIAVVGRALRLPAAPAAVDAFAAFANYQPWLRRTLSDLIGAGAADTALSLVSVGARIATLSPAALSVDLAMQGIKAAENHAAAQAWRRLEPQLARHADHAQAHRSARPVPPAAGPAERHAKRMAITQVIGAGLAGAITGKPAVAANAVVVATPRAMRSTTESFAATLGQGLAEKHGVLPLRPHGLRRLDKVDTVLIDPRVLRGDQLHLVGKAPKNTQTAPGQHRLAPALLAEARAAGVQIVSLDVDILGELRPAFDELRPVQTGGTRNFDVACDQALAGAVTDLQQAGRTVAVLSCSGARSLSAADVALGLMPAGEAAPPFDADLLLADLAGAWRVLHALPAAREATARGVAIATGASALGAVLMIPGTRGGRSPGAPVTLGSAAGMLSGYLLARRAVQATAPKPAPAHRWHAMSVAQVREVLSAPDPDTRADAEPPPPNMVWQFVKAVRAELSDPLMPVLALCSTATAMLGSPIDAMMVSTVLIGNCMLAAGQQLQAENRLNRLLARQAPPARTVIESPVCPDSPDGPDGPHGTRGYREVVVSRLQAGDVIELRSNEVVPADARVIEATDLEVDESALTGESLPVDKQTAAVPPGAELAERSCMLYAGTTVVAGTAVALVTAVGADTQARRAAELATGELPVVGLQHQLSQLMRQAFPASAVGGGLVGALEMLRGGNLRLALGSAIAVAVAAVPEGMPLMATLAQHASAQRLAKTGALVRIPRSVEALGRVEVVCFDKTGTLSQNRLRVTRVHPMRGQSDADVLRWAAHAAPATRGAAYAHATDQAIVEAATPHLPDPSPPDAHLPFRSGRAFSASVTGTELTVKGAPEVVLAACPGAGRAAGTTVAKMAAGGLRVIAVARRELTARQAQAVKKDPDGIVGLCRTGLTLAGFLGITDTPRAEAPQLLADLTERGVGIRLITGDHPATATAIAAELGMPVAADQVVTGSQWNALSRKDQEQMVRERVIFARMSPENKVQIVQTLERGGQVCAMVGDGANDAAAIRAASVGFGVVARGSDAAHTTADIVLTDGRISALTDAIDEGRRLWRGVQLAISGLLGGNLGEVIFSVIGTAVTGSSPLNNRQLLLMNMLTDALPATSVAVSTPTGPATRVRGGIDKPRLMRAVAFRGAITATAATTAWAMASVTGRRQRAATVALISLVTTELGQSLVDSHAPLVLLTSAGSFAVFAAMITVPGVSQLLGCTPVGPVGWAQGVGTATAAVLAMAAANRLLPAAWRGAEPPEQDAVPAPDGSPGDKVMVPLRTPTPAA
ncbi:MAG TPA: cation-translocating P-type ATPase [Mycobacterium sp.]|nr:cation-translocating P-type ATPase [Mycobacterium sp.]